MAVCGPHKGSEEVIRAAEEVGSLLAQAGVIVVTGGLGGVMEAASRGAVASGGVTLGILPGEQRDEANDFVKIVIPTGMGEMRNALIVRAADGLVAVGGGFGTLSEIAFALRLGKPVVTLRPTWDIAHRDDIVPVTSAESPREAVEALLAVL